MGAKRLSDLKGELRFSSLIFRHALRAALAITLAVALVRQLQLFHALWVPLTVLVVMRPSLGGTLQISAKRMAGTAAGAAGGVLLAYLGLPVPVVGAAAFFMLFLVFYFKGRNYLVFTAFLTSDLVLILSAAFPHTWQSGAERLLDTFLGIAIGLAASFLVWPNFARKNLRSSIGDLVAAQHAHFTSLCNAYFDQSPGADSLLSGRLRARELLDSCAGKCADAAVEPGLISSQRQDLMHLIDIFSRIHQVLTALATIVGNSAEVFNAEIRPDLEDLLDRVGRLFVQLETYARTGEETGEDPEFKPNFNRFMARLGRLRALGEFEAFSLDTRNTASVFVLQIDRIGTGLEAAIAGLKAVREAR